MKLKRVFCIALLVLIALAGFKSFASADFILRIENTSTGQGAVITDGGAGDLAPLAGVILFTDFIGGLAIDVTTGISKPIIGGTNNYSELDLNSIHTQVSGAGVIRLTLVDTDFTNGPDGPSIVIGGVGGTLTAPPGSFVTFNTWANPDNLVPALGPNTFPVAALGAIGGIPAGSVAVFGSGVTFGPGAYSTDGTEEFLKSGPYSLFSQATISFAGPGIVSFDFNTQVVSPEQVVPEPSTLLLLGSGLLGVARWARRYAKKSS